jgi:serine/threonine protein kinase
MSISQSTIDDYQVLLKNEQCLGKGSYGYVTLVRGKVSQKSFAMKVVKKAFLIRNSPEGVSLLRKEIAINQKLTHKNVIRIYDCFEDTKHFYLVMEHAEGGNLQKKLTGKLTEKDAFKIFEQILTGLKYLHSNKYFTHQ